MLTNEIEKLKESINKCLLLEDILGVDMTSQIEALKEQLNNLVKGY
jgi:hypothetical protein